MKIIFIITAMLMWSSLSSATPCHYANSSNPDQYQKWLKMNTVKRLFSDAGNGNNTINMPNIIACKIALESNQLNTAFDQVINDVENNAFFVRQPVQFANRAIRRISFRTIIQNTKNLLDNMITANQGSHSLLSEALDIRDTLSNWNAFTFQYRKTRYIFQEEYILPMMRHVLERESVVTNKYYLRYTIKHQYGKSRVKLRYNCGLLNCGDSIFTAYTPTHDYFTADNVCHGGLYGINNYGSVEDGFIFRLDTEEQTATALTGINTTASNIASYQGNIYFIEQLSSEDRSSIIHRYNLNTQTLTAESSTISYPIYRLTYDQRNHVLKATSLSYMYDFDIATGTKSVLGQLSYPNDSFKHGDIDFGDNGFTFYVLTGKALYSANLNDLVLTEIGQHGIKEASGLAVTPEGIIYASGFDEEGTPTIYSLDPFTAQPNTIFSLDYRINDLTYVENFCSN